MQSNASLYPEVASQRIFLDRLFDKAGALENAEGVDEETIAHFTWYLCVRTSGYLEFSIKTILREHMKSLIEREEFRNESRVSSFVLLQLDRIVDPNQTFNPTRRRLLSLLSNFSTEWRNEVECEIDGKLGNSLDSIVRNRNQIAHGRDVSLTLHELRDYLNDAQKVLRLLENSSGKASFSNN